LEGEGDREDRGDREKVIGNGNANHDNADMLMMKSMMLTMAFGECHLQWVSMQMLTKLVSKRIDYAHTRTRRHRHRHAHTDSGC